MSQTIVRPLQEIGSFAHTDKFSIAKFELKLSGSGTRLVFDHIGFPEGLHDHLAEGWESNYWMLLKKYFH